MLVVYVAYGNWPPSHDFIGVADELEASRSRIPHINCRLCYNLLGILFIIEAPSTTDILAVEIFPSYFSVSSSSICLIMAAYEHNIGHRG
jgi:hypothetical protein